MNLIDLDDDRHFYIHDDADGYEVWNIKRDATVDAVPVSFIQQRIDQLQNVADFALESNGGYIESANSSLYELKMLLSRWKAERSAKGL